VLQLYLLYTKLLLIHWSRAWLQRDSTNDKQQPGMVAGTLSHTHTHTHIHERARERVVPLDQKSHHSPNSQLLSNKNKHPRAHTRTHSHTHKRGRRRIDVCCMCIYLFPSKCLEVCTTPSSRPKKRRTDRSGLHVFMLPSPKIKRKNDTQGKIAHNKKTAAKIMMLHRARSALSSTPAPP
jgi:hypothetical protein